MIKIIVFLFFFSLNSFGAKTLRDSNAESPTIRITSPATVNLVIDSSSDGGVSESSPIKFYVPFLRTAGVANSTYHTVTSSLPSLTAESTGTGTFEFHFEVIREGVNQYIYFAVEKDDDEYEIVKVSSELTSDYSDYTQTITISELCAANNLDCNPLLVTTTSNSTINKKIYAFLHTSNGLAINQTINPADSDYSNGVFYEGFLSNKIDSSNTINLKNLRKGDKQLVADYAGFGFNYHYKTYSYLHDGANCTNDSSVVTWSSRTAGGSLFDMETTNTSGEAKIKNLQNDRCYSSRVVFVDKFLFASILSNRITETPESIEALLKKQACFFFTAGFNGSHPVIDKLRLFRDQVLRKSVLGEAFVYLYYNLAPHYTKYILSNPLFAQIIRFFGHIMSFLMSLWTIIFLFLASLFALKFSTYRRHNGRS